MFSLLKSITLVEICPAGYNVLMNYLSVETPIGRLVIAGEGEFVTNIYFEGEAPFDTKNPRPSGTPFAKGGISVLEIAASPIAEHFAGKRKIFDVPIRPAGGEFHKNVWEVMIKNVPFGATISYGEIACLALNPKAARAVGMANNRNPIPIIIPCHRIVGSGGKLTGFRGGLDIKQKLLDFEKTCDSMNV